MWCGYRLTISPSAVRICKIHPQQVLVTRLIYYLETTLFMASCHPVVPMKTRLGPNPSNKKPGSNTRFFKMSNCLNDGNFGAADRAAAEGADFAATKSNDAVTSGVDGVVAANAGADATTFAEADLADDDLADFDFLTTKQLDAEALTG